MNSAFIADMKLDKSPKIVHFILYFEHYLYFLPQPTNYAAHLQLVGQVSTVRGVYSATYAADAAVCQ